MTASSSSGTFPASAPPLPRGPGGGLDDAPRIARALARSQAVADLLDRAYRVPGTNIRFGLDAIAGLVPVVGDTATTIVGLYPLLEAVRLGIPKRTVARMSLNLGIDWLIGLIPIVDIVFDVAYKANVRNVQLLAVALTKRQLEAEADA